MNPAEPWVYAMLALIAVASGFVYGVSGFGAALVSIPLSTHFVPLPFALAVFVVVDLANAVRVGLQAPQHVVRSEVIRMVPAIVCGTALGMTVLVHLPRTGAMIALGVFVCAFALYSLLSRDAIRPLRQGWAYVAGAAGGITGTLFGAGGPPYAIYLAHRGHGKEAYRATLALTSVASISIRFVAFVLVGLMGDVALWIAIACALPASWLGVTAASHLYARLPQRTVMRVVALMLLASGVSLLVRAGL